MKCADYVLILKQAENLVRETGYNIVRLRNDNIRGEEWSRALSIHTLAVMHLTTLGDILECRSLTDRFIAETWHL